MKNCPTFTPRGREAKQASLSGPNLDDQKKTRLYDLQAKEGKGSNTDGGNGT